MQLQRLILIAAFGAIVSLGCESTPKAASAGRGDPLTHGNVQMKLATGKTTQTEVLEAFGAPNITTLDADGKEVWTYRRHASVSTASGENGYFNILIAGASSASSNASQSATSMTLIIKFDATKKVVDFKSMSSSF